MKNIHNLRNLVLLGVILTMVAETGWCLKIIAHRGDSFHFPENTLPSFRSAVQKEADLVELDGRRTKDGVLVVFHDGTLDKKTDSVEILGATGFAVENLTYEQIQKLDAGKWKNSEFAGTLVPTLEESLRTIQENGGTTLLERKTGPALEYAKLIEKLGYTKKLVVQAFDWEFLAALHTWNPKIQLAALSGKKVTEDLLDDLDRTGIRIVVWDHEEINEKSFSQIKNRGLELWCYTIDDPKEWKRLVDLGVDGIITDKPAELREWLNRNHVEP